MSLPKVLVLMGCFGRGIEATGPNQSMIGIARTLENKFDFRVVAEAVEGDKIGEWQTVAGIPQMPVPKGLAGARDLLAVIRATPHDILITNGFFDQTMTLPLLLMRKMGAIPRRPTLLAPHGEFSIGALKLKGGRKRLYRAALKQFNMFDDIAFLATNEEEADAIREHGNFGKPIYVCPTIRPLPPMPAHTLPSPGYPLRVVFANRIDDKKNLEFAIDILSKSGVTAIFNIFGPITSSQYWERCKEAINRAPSHLTISHKGVLSQAEILDTLADHDLMLLPTLGENFGHSIADALLAGTPSLLSDRTPWRDLNESLAGWDLPLERPELFVEAIREFNGLSIDERMRWRRGARAFVEKNLDTEGAARALEDALNSLL